MYLPLMSLRSKPIESFFHLHFQILRQMLAARCQALHPLYIGVGLVCSSWGASIARLHAGNGWRDDSLNAVISSRTLLLRSTIFSISFSIAPQSLPVQSGGTSPATSPITAGARFSTRESHGSNDSHPLTCW